ncbi:hypothetical protein [Fretibacter rubidus]|uniref:hypothetical protein n=1 Tax=Fretibacter rubidus TaxID=570162 RepID=UPI00352B3327
MQYKYEQQYRTKTILVALVFAAGFTAFGYIQNAPWYFLTITGVPMALLAYNVVVNPLSGIDLNQRFLRVYSGHWDKRVNINAIDKVIVKRRSDDGDLYLVQPKGGKAIIIPSNCIKAPDVFEQTLSHLGLTVEEFQPAVLTNPLS